MSEPHKWFCSVHGTVEPTRYACVNTVLDNYRKRIRTLEADREKYIADVSYACERVVKAEAEVARLREISEGQARLANAIERARRAEREACAMIADAPEWDWHSSGHGDEQWPCLSAQAIAAAIRARAQE